MSVMLGILSIMAVGGGGSSSAAAFVAPSSGGNASLKRHRHSLPPGPFPEATTRRQSTMYFRDDDTFDAIGALRPQERGRSSDFQSRMKNIVKQNRRRSNAMNRPKNVKTATSLEEFAEVIEEGRREGKLVVVRFVATWCKLCHSLRPIFDKAASSNPEAIFVDVPILETNSNLHQGLGVESVPFGHIYHPDKGLVEETKLSRKSFAEFEELVRMHCA